MYRAIEKCAKPVIAAEGIAAFVEKREAKFRGR